MSMEEPLLANAEIDVTTDNVTEIPSQEKIETQQEEINLISFDENDEQQEQKENQKEEEKININNKDETSSCQIIKNGFIRAIEFADSVTCQCVDKVKQLHVTQVLSNVFGKMCHAVDNSTITIFSFIPK
ncbi:uncharacterized protein GO595_006095 [Histomonas meleagridis]|uniref:uncharacterized protein n=1 Tax=Histomonas meleagridis TaxID=135588 RepID=UPI003559DC2A|nr:hypothetical protein GO595_006095 [Histomonas meleagridis]